MKRFDSKRRLSNMRLTRPLHVPLMGLWILIACVSVALIDALMYRIYEQDAALMAAAAGGLESTQRLRPFQVLTLLTLMSTALISAITLLAIITAHRAAGPYLAIRRTLTALRDGDSTSRLHFRKGDGLDDLADLFNETMDQVAGKPQADEEDAPPLSVVGD